MLRWVSQLRPSQAEEGGCTRISQTGGKRQILSPDSHQATEGCTLAQKMPVSFSPLQWELHFLSHLNSGDLHVTADLGWEPFLISPLGVLSVATLGDCCTAPDPLGAGRWHLLHLL